MNINLLVIIFFTVFIISCTSGSKSEPPEPKTETAKEYYSDGKLKSETESFNGKANGLSKNYSKDGALESVYTFSDGIRQGPAVEYYPSGELKQKMYYKNGKREGMVVWYYKNGKIFRETPYKDGKTDGMVKSYYQDGKIMSEALYLNSFPGLEMKEYDSRGNLKKDDTKLIIREVNRKPVQGKILLDIYLSSKHPGTTYFRGDLTEGKFLNESLSRIPEENGVARFAYIVGQQPLKVTVSYQTDNSSLRVLTKTYSYMGDR